MNWKQFPQKVGRNDPCPCGSGKKFKKCHGAVVQSKSSTGIDPKVVKREFDKIKAVEQQRKKQQGLGRPIISEVINGCRIVGVGGEVLASPMWKTFHDFLSDYIKKILGEVWGTNELKNPVHKRHPLMNWYERAEIFWNSVIKERGKVHRATGTGAVIGVLGLAYNLYLLAHNAKIQELLIRRLKNCDNFFGAYYETCVAGALIKAGFDLEFEDETDPTTSHCEFTAVCRATGKKFSVEAKARGPNKASAGVGKQLIKALKKRALHTRVVFIEANVRDDGNEAQTKQVLAQILTSLRNWEPKLVIDDQPAPPAYIIITNNPFHYDPDGPSRRWALGEGFKISDFKLGAQFASLRDAIKSREKHIEMFNLMQSLAEHDKIPSTFDGEIPDLAFGQTEARLLVGQQYIVPDHEGKEVVAELVDAVVMEEQKSASCVMELADTRHIIVNFPLTDDELNAYRKHPDTFFGVVKSHTGKIKDPLDLFDFFFNGYGKTSKERLLELMKDAADLEHLRKLPQEEIALTYCERLVYGVMQMGRSPKQEATPTPTNDSQS